MHCRSFERLLFLIEQAHWFYEVPNPALKTRLLRAQWCPPHINALGFFAYIVRKRSACCCAGLCAGSGSGRAAGQLVAEALGHAHLQRVPGAAAVFGRAGRHLQAVQRLQAGVCLIANPAQSILQSQFNLKPIMGLQPNSGCAGCYLQAVRRPQASGFG